MTNSNLKCRVSPYEANHIKKDLTMISLADGSQQQGLDRSLVNFLASCRNFQTLSEHFEHYWAESSFRDKIIAIASLMKIYLKRHPSLPFGNRVFEHIFVDALIRLKHQGYLIDLDQFRDTISSNGRVSRQGSITSVAVVTKNNPLSLEKSLESYIQNALDFNHRPRFCVYDDSSNRDAVNSLIKLKKRFGIEIWFSGQDEKKFFLQKLIEQGQPEDVARFLLFGAEDNLPTYGANRNSFLLDTLGELTFCADDDTVCKVSKPQMSDYGLQVGYENNREEVVSYLSREEACRVNPFESVDIFSILGNYLGRSAGDVMVQHFFGEEMYPSGKLPDTKNMGVQFFKNILEDKARIVFALPGLLGDSGSTSANRSLLATGEHFERIVKSKEHFDLVLSSREILKTTKNTLLIQSEQFMTTFFGLDNRDPLPPFFPIFREEDTLFGVMLGESSKSACTVYLPYTLLHSPDANRYYPKVSDDVHLTVTPCSFIQSELWSSRNSLIDIPIETMLKRLGERLLDYSEASHDKFLSILKIHRANLLAHELRRIEFVINQNKKGPWYWRKEIDRFAKNYRALASDVSLGELLGGEIIEICGESGGVAYFQKIINKYGKLLLCWPDIVSATKLLKSRGVTVSQRI